MRIMIAYPGNSVSTIDVANGYLRALGELGHPVRPFNYHDSLAFYQGAIDYWRGRNPEFAPDKNAYLVLASERLIIEAIDFAPDIVLVVAGMALHRRAYELLHRLGIPIALLLTESPYLDKAQALIQKKGHIQVAFTNDSGSVKRLQRMTGVRTVYLPHSYDPAIHRPFDVDPNYRNDVFFQGTLWPERKRLFDGLEHLPYKVRIAGIDPFVTDEDSADKVIADQMDNAELATWYNGTQIALNHHRTFIGVNSQAEECHIRTKAYSIGPRAFEIAACGAFQLCDDSRPELHEVFGDSVATYTDGDDLQRKIAYYLTHADERQMMADAARARVQGCSFVERAKNIVMPALTEV